MFRLTGFTTALLLFAIGSTGFAQDLPKPEAPGDSSAPREIRDNSFFIEEAFNQEEGVVQHINGYSRDTRSGDWVYTFTQEWPAPGITHQLSYSVPLVSSADSTRHAHVGDVILNYRYQLAGDGDSAFACAPRVSVVTPTGDEKRGAGTGGWGLQVNLPVSYLLTDRFAIHGNAGGTWTYRARSAEGDRGNLGQFAAGGSLVWIASHDANFLLEALWTRTEEMRAGGRRDWTSDTTLVPGLRWAFDFAGGLQIVPGIGFPIGVGGSRGDRGVFLYLSFEHSFQRK